MPANDAQRLAELRVQDGRPKLMTPSLRALLGGDDIQPGRAQEALVIWQSLRGRAAGGDVAASEDMGLLMLKLANHPRTGDDTELILALTESSLDAAVLPRHRQEHLSRLCRRAVIAGDAARALSVLGEMDPAPQDLESDSEYRIAATLVALLTRDPARALALLGSQKDAIPIDDSCDSLASVLRAHAHELMGDVNTAARVLRELPDQGLVQAVRAAYPALALCEQSSTIYLATLAAEGAARARRNASSFKRGLGLAIALLGLFLGIAGYAMAVLVDEQDADSVGYGFVGLGGLVLLAALALLVSAYRSGRRAEWLRLNGKRLRAMFAAAEPTGTLINRVRVYVLTLQVQGEQGPYTVTLQRPLLEHELSQLVGSSVFVRVHPADGSELVLE